MNILAIETSCDETGIAVIHAEGGITSPSFKILSNVVSSQIPVHAPWGGVVPNLAKREHLINLPIVLKKAFLKAKIKSPERTVDAIAVTVGPGLEPALWTGINFALDLAEKWNKRIVAVNHMEGHMVSSLLGRNKITLRFPTLALLVSGGHTELILSRGWLSYKKIGETLDDASGEAFDKVAKMLGLGYPGGPAISKLARRGERDAISFPRPMIRSNNYNFSFSGLKTSVLYYLRDHPRANKADVAASFEEAVVDVLIRKTIRAASHYKVKSIILGGGVAANERLRSRISKEQKNALPHLALILPDKKFTADNAAMIGACGYLHALTARPSRLRSLSADATLSM